MLRSFYVPSICKDIARWAVCFEYSLLAHRIALLYVFPKCFDIIIISALRSTKLALGVRVIIHLAAVLADFERCARVCNEHGVGETEGIQ